jgi:uncharacterized protein
LLCRGARDIIARWINENIYVRSCDAFFSRTATVSTKGSKKQKKKRLKKSLINISIGHEPLSKAPSHRLLAVRAVNERFCKLKGRS